MEVTFKTIEQMLDLNRDIRGLVRHSRAMSEKASAGIYRVSSKGGSTMMCFQHPGRGLPLGWNNFIEI